MTHSKDGTMVMSVVVDVLDRHSRVAMGAWVFLIAIALAMSGASTPSAIIAIECGWIPLASRKVVRFSKARHGTTPAHAQRH